MKRRKFLIVTSGLSLLWFSTGCTPKESKSVNSPTAASLTSDSEGHLDPQGYWTCSMHPQVHQHEPGKCPICGMALIHVKGDSQVQKKEVVEIEASDAQIKNAQIGKYTVVKKNLAISIPVSGRMLSSKEVAFQVYESDLSNIRPGLEFSGVSSSSPDKTISGHITRIDNLVDPSSRTVRVLGSLSTAALNSPSESGFHGEIMITLSNQIVVPEEAILFTGTRNLVYIFSNDNKLEPREVQVGLKGHKEYQVLSGLKESEIISTGPNFLIDSEAKIRGL